MALVLPADTRDVITVDDFVDFVRTNVDLYDVDSIASAAQKLLALANDRDLVVRQLNQRIKERFHNQLFASVQSIYLGHGPEFYVRANIWPSGADLNSGRMYQDRFSYNAAHDHNFHFMTVGYHGPGYVTDLYEYDHAKVQGRIGEHVDLRYVNQVHFRTGMVMLYRAGVDVHTQLPPDDLSLSLNLMVATPDVRVREQYFFDTQNSTLVDYPGGVDSTVRASILELAAEVGDDDTRQLLHDLSHAHPCRRTRLAAFQSLAQLSPAEEAQIWEEACRDPEPLVSGTALDRLRDASSTQP